MFVKMDLGLHVVVLLYVDNMIITEDNVAEITGLRDVLSIQFEMKILGEVGCFLGLQVEKAKGGFFLSQKRYSRSLLEHFGMEEAKPKATPMEPCLRLKRHEGKPLNWMQNDFNNLWVA